MTYNVSEMAIKIHVAHRGHVARITVAQRNAVEISEPVAQLGLTWQATFAAFKLKRGIA